MGLPSFWFLTGILGAIEYLTFISLNVKIEEISIIKEVLYHKKEEITFTRRQCARFTKH